MKNILLIEDDTFLQQLYNELLSQEGYKVTAVDDGKMALTKIQEGTWDLILLDVMLPNMDGFEIFSVLMKDKKRPSCPIVFMTNLDSNDDDKEKLSQANDYWIKSNMSPPEFVEKVKQMLA